MNDKDFELLFKSRFKSLCNLAFTMVKDADIAKDIVQQVFIKLWQKQDDLNIRGPKEAYLYRMVINTSINHIEKEKRNTRLEEQTLQTLEKSTENQDDIETIEEREKKVREAVAELPAQCQAVFSLSRFERLTNKEIAAHLGISVKTVEKHITTALKKLHEKLRPLFKSGLDVIIIFLSSEFLLKMVGLLLGQLSY